MVDYSRPIYDLINRHKKLLEDVKSIYSICSDSNSYFYDSSMIDDTISLYKYILGFLIHHTKYYITIYKKCIVKYKLYTLINKNYNEMALIDLNRLIDYSLSELKYLRVLKNTLKNITKTKNSNNFDNHIDILFNLFTLTMAIQEEFDYICDVVEMKYKGIYYIPKTEEKVNIKTLIESIDKSLKSMVR